MVIFCIKINQFKQNLKFFNLSQYLLCFFMYKYNTFYKLTLFSSNQAVVMFLHINFHWVKFEIFQISQFNNFNSYEKNKIRIKY